MRDFTQTRLRDIASRVAVRNSTGNTNVLTISAAHGLVSQEEYFNRRVASADVSQYYLLREGDFAYNKSYSTGWPVGVVRRLERYSRGVVSPLYICFRPDSTQVDPSYLQYYFDSGALNDEVLLIAKEGVRNHGLLNVGVNDFFDLPLILPSLAKQRRIAKILDEVGAQIDLLRSTELKNRHLNEGLVSRLLEGDEHWRSLPIGELGILATGRTPAVDFTSSTSTDIPFVTPSEISDGGRVSRPERAAERDSDGVVNIPAGATLTVCIGFGIGKVGFLDFDACVNQQINALIPHAEMDETFVFHSLKTASHQIKAQAPLQVTPIINKTEFSKITVKVPNLAEQKRISGIIAQITIEADAIQQEIAKLQTVKQALMGDLFTRTV
ncbi:restriction endonuclease subunit S [Streptomyces mirabilis]|uniref:restriction endonuclease subunit S n=1 Tax=Streptomyces mirabilis TaxID=68239 RepID=UPI0036EAC20D